MNVVGGINPNTVRHIAENRDYVITRDRYAFENASSSPGQNVFLSRDILL